METAKVDIRKLQLLNDRINQTIDALNQVRLSVHGLGLSHSPFVPQTGAWTGFQPGLPGTYGAGYGLTPQVPFVPGLAHSTGVYGPTPFLPTMQTPWTNPFQTVQAWNPYQAIQGFYPYLGISGLSHTSMDVTDPGRTLAQTALDPLTLTRMNQTFPFIQSLYCPV